MIGKTIDQGQRLPKGYGIAWGEFHTFRYYCLPIPFNRIANWIRNLYFRVQGPGYDPVMKAYHQGMLRGTEYGMQLRDALERELRRIFDPRMEKK